MGLRYRKSINLGGGFRINLSKSGVGYSFGAKGIRYTKTATGRKRSTLSIPGTGISYVNETGNNSVKSSTPIPVDTPEPEINTYDSKAIENAAANTIVSEGMEEMLKSAKMALAIGTISAWTALVSAVLSIVYPAFLVLTAICLIILLIIRKKGIISLEYTIDDYQMNIVNERLTPLRQVIKSSVIWRINETSKVKDSKYSAGATGSVKRSRTKATTKVPFPFKTDVDVVCFRDSKETLVFLPDRLIIIQGLKIGALEYSDLDISFGKTIFVESQVVPKDATVIGKTWKYVNKSGGADKRFKDNKQLPQCSYGLLGLDSPKGVDAMFMFSNPGIVGECQQVNNN